MHMENMGISNEIIAALYIKISFNAQETSRLTFKSIFKLSLIKEPSRQKNKLKELISKNEYYRISTLAEELNKNNSPDKTNNILDLKNIIKICLSDNYIHYHIVRSSLFKDSVLKLYNSYYKYHHEIRQYKKSDDIYQFIVEHLPPPDKKTISKGEVFDISHRVNQYFHHSEEFLHIEELKQIIEPTDILYQMQYNSLSFNQETHPNNVSIYWGTNRASITKNDKTQFTDERNNGVALSEQLRFGRSLVTIPNVHEYGEIERPAPWWKIWKETEEDVYQHITIHSIELIDKDKWQSSLKETYAGKEGMLFIHGYNCSFEDALYRAAQLKYDLKFDGAAFCFSWASKAKILSYNIDESTIDWSTSHLEQFIDLITKDLNLTRLHIVAHSMGNRALLDVINRWNGQKKNIHTVVLAAPDVDVDKMKNIEKCFSQFENVTLYSSKHDIPVNISGKIHGYLRAGNAMPPLVLQSTDTIDVSNIGKPIFSLGHSYFADAFSVFNDLYYLINQKSPPLIELAYLSKRNGAATF